MPVEITAKRHGFRRCGVAHSITPTVHPDGRFTAEEVERLKAEPMLIVRDLSADSPCDTATGLLRTGGRQNDGRELEDDPAERAPKGKARRKAAPRPTPDDDEAS